MEGPGNCQIDILSMTRLAAFTHTSNKKKLFKSMPDYAQNIMINLLLLISDVQCCRHTISTERRPGEQNGEPRAACEKEEVT